MLRPFACWLPECDAIYATGLPAVPRMLRGVHPTEYSSEAKATELSGMRRGLGAGAKKHRATGYGHL